MFTKQMPQLAGAIRGHVPDLVINALEHVIGNGASSLSHRGPVTIAIDGNYLPSIGPTPRGSAIPRNCDGSAKAALTVSNIAGAFAGLDCKTSCVDRGLALRAIGPSQFDSARIDRLYVNEIRNLCGTLIAKGGETGGGGEDPEDPPTGTPKFNVLRFRVTNDNPVPGTPSIALANLLSRQGNAYAPVGSTIAIVDYTPTSEFSSRWRTGFYGYCIKKADRPTVLVSGTTYPCYEVLWVESYARWVEFRLTTNVVDGEAEGTVVRVWGSTAGVSPGSRVLVKDRMNKIPNARPGYSGIAIHDEKLRQYVVLADETPGVTSIPLDSLTKCAQIMDGERKDQCVYDARIVEPANIAGTCGGSLFNGVAPVWLMVPNFRTDVNEGSYHWAKLVQPEFDVDGDIRPLYFTDYDPDDFVTLRIQSGTSRGANCLFPAKVVKFNYDAAREGEACDISNEDGDDVFVYMPNFGECPTIGKDVYLMARRTSPNVYVALEGFHDECSQLAVVGTSATDFSCATENVLNTVTDSPGVEPHLLDQALFSGDSFSTKNYFSFCGVIGNKLLSLIGHAPGADLLHTGVLMTAQHECLSPVSHFSPDGLCKLQYGNTPTSIPVCGVSRTEKLDLSGVVCDCPCEGNSGDCDCFGPTDVVSATMRFTGTRVCPAGSVELITKTWNFALTFNGANGWHEGTFTTTDSYPRIYYIVLYHCGNEAPATRTGLVVFDCNVPQENGPFGAIFDEDGNPTPGGCVVDLFTWDRTNPFVFDENDCAACTRTYRVRVKCTGMNLQPDGSFRPTIESELAVLHRFTGNSVPDEITLGTVLEGGCNSAVLGNFVSTGWGTGEPGYENHAFAGFATGSGTTTLNW